MPIQMGLCSSHAPGLFQFTVRGWEATHHRLHTSRNAVVSPELWQETPEVLEGYIRRIKHNWATMKAQLTAFNPDVLVAVIGDQREWFDGSNIPNILVYNGPDTWGVHNTGQFDEDPIPDTGEDPRFRLSIKVDRELSQMILEGLLKEGFDVAWSSVNNPQSQPKRGVPHGMCNPAPHLMPRPDLPVVLVFVNVDDGPPVQINGERAYQLGQAIARICEKSDKRIAIYGSGGMSHDPRGPRSGWVDEPLDQWFLDQLSTGQLQNLKSMFSFRSENFRSGTGELRCWIVVAGAMDYVKPGHKAVVVDYLPARKVTTGCGWVYYPPVEAPALAGAR